MVTETDVLEADAYLLFYTLRSLVGQGHRSKGTA